MMRTGVGSKRHNCSSKTHDRFSFRIQHCVCRLDLEEITIGEWSNRCSVRLISVVRTIGTN